MTPALAPWFALAFPLVGCVLVALRLWDARHGGAPL